MSVLIGNPLRPNGAVAYQGYTMASACLKLLGKDKFFGAPGEAPRYDYPNPQIARQPTDLKTFTNPVETQLIGKDQFFGAPGERINYDQPNPTLLKYPSDLRTFINPTELQLIGKDTFFGAPGQAPVYDYPNPTLLKSASELRTHINIARLGLRDVFFGLAGNPNFDWPNPLVYRPAIDLRTLALSTIQLQPFGQVPFLQTDWPNPLFVRYRQLDLVPNSTILFPIAFPFNMTDWPNPLAYRPGMDLKTWVQATVQLQAFGQKPFSQNHWPNPWFPPYRDFTPVPNLAATTMFLVIYPFRLLDWPNPTLAADRSAQARTWLQSTVHLQSFGQMPFSQLDWVTPKWSAFRDVMGSSNSLILIPIALPFNLYDWPNPIGRLFPIDIRTLTGPVRLQLIGKDTFFGAPGQPPANRDWPNPRGYIYPMDLRTWLQAVASNLVGQDTFFGGPGQPPANLDWPVPRGYPFPVDARSITQRRVDLFGKDTFFGAPGEAPRYDYPNPLFRPLPVAARTHVEALKQLILHKDKFFGGPGQPPSNRDWPNPLRYIPANELKTLLVNLQESTLGIPPRVFQIAMITGDTYLATDVNGDFFAITGVGSDTVLLTKVGDSSVKMTDVTGDSSANTDVDDDTDLESE